MLRKRLFRWPPESNGSRKDIGQPKMCNVRHVSAGLDPIVFEEAEIEHVAVEGETVRARISLILL